MNKKQPFSQFAVLIVVSLALIGLNKAGWFQKARGRIDKFLEPAKIDVRNIFVNARQRTQDIKTDLKDLAFLEEKISVLEQENLSLRAQNEDIIKENNEMRKLLGAPLPPKWHFVPAKIVSQMDQMIVINQGRGQGLAAGQAVVVEKIFIGQVKTVEEQTARIQLAVHPDFSTEALVEKSGLSGKARVYGSRLFIEKVPVGNKLAAGDLVTRKEDGLVLGTIGEVVNSDEQTFQKAEIVWPVDLDHLREVFVVLKEN